MEKLLKSHQLEILPHFRTWLEHNSDYCGLYFDVWRPSSCAVLESSETPKDPFSRPQSTPEPRHASVEPLKPIQTSRRMECWQFHLLLKTMSINPWCSIFLKPEMRHILSYFPGTDWPQIDIFCQGRRLKQAESKFNPLAAVQVKLFIVLQTRFSTAKKYFSCKSDVRRSFWFACTPYLTLRLYVCPWSTNAA